MALALEAASAERAASHRARRSGPLGLHGVDELDELADIATRMASALTGHSTDPVAIECWHALRAGIDAISTT